MKRKTITKKMREEVFNKYDGHCAYCGCVIEKNAFHVDHMKPVREIGGKMDNPENDVFDNLMPSCRSCNIRKGSGSIEFFRGEMERSIEVLRRDSTTFKFAEKYNQVKCTPSKIKFYFETVSKEE